MLFLCLMFNVMNMILFLLNPFTPVVPVGTTLFLAFYNSWKSKLTSFMCPLMMNLVCGDPIKNMDSKCAF